MIERDLRARGKSSRTMKDYTTVVHRHWLKEERTRKASNQSRLNAAREHGLKDQMRDTNEFSDDEFELPDIEEIFK